MSQEHDGNMTGHWNALFQKENSRNDDVSDQIQIQLNAPYYIYIFKKKIIDLGTSTATIQYQLKCKCTTQNNKVLKLVVVFSSGNM